MLRSFATWKPFIIVACCLPILVHVAILETIMLQLPLSGTNDSSVRICWLVSFGGSKVFKMGTGTSIRIAMQGPSEPCLE